MTRSAIPRTQALESVTFKAPLALLEDPDKTIVDIYQWNGSHNAQHTLFRYQDGQDIHEINWKDAVHAIRRAAHLFASQVQHNAPADTVPPVVAILASTGQCMRYVRSPACI